MVHRSQESSRRGPRDELVDAHQHQSMSQYMKNKLSKSRMQVIDSQSSSDYNAPTIPLTPHRPFLTHSSNNKVGYVYHSLIDDDSGGRTPGRRTNDTQSTKYLQRSDDSSGDESTIRNSNLRSASLSRTLSSGSANNSDNSNKLLALVEYH
jgi:hypothetical protein